LGHLSGDWLESVNQLQYLLFAPLRLCGENCLRNLASISEFFTEGFAMTIAEVKKALLKASVVLNGKNTITCEKLLKLSMKLKVSPARIGSLCDDLGIKITKCKLGCFS
jgi:hypothetical protein